jgi:hypothetical protein
MEFTVFARSCQLKLKKIQRLAPLQGRATIPAGMEGAITPQTGGLRVKLERRSGGER